jgi:Camelysin metallo-endopeptidase
MAVRPKLMMSVGVAVAGLGLIGAGAGATFTAQVAGSTAISSGGVGLSLNDKTGSDLHLGLDGKNLGSHFTPISNDLVLKNTGTLDMAATYLSLTATGCDGREGAALAQALHVKLTEVAGHDDKTGNHADKVIYDGALCSMAKSKSSQGSSDSTAHAGVGGQLPHMLSAGESANYRLVIQPDDTKQGLPSAAQYASTTVNLVFSGFDY